MSPPDVVIEEAGRGFPRVSGDEPNSGSSVTESSQFSPRERG